MPAATKSFKNPVEEDVASARGFCKDVETLRRKFARDIIASGFVSNTGGPYWEEVLYALAEERAARDCKQLRDVLNRLEARTPDATKLVAHDGREQLAEDLLDDVIAQWADVGFALGVAVGMQLGPHAFDSVTR